jgi:hypothetical protein
MDKRKHRCMGCAGYFEYPFHKNALLKTSTPLFLLIDIIGKGFHLALSLLVFERLFLSSQHRALHVSSRSSTSSKRNAFLAHVIR